ncbi:MAG: MFS transporter, partial [Halobacteriales archaeon]
MGQSRLGFGSLYLTKFASSFGAITVYTLLGTYVEVLGAEGLVVGLFTTALTLTQTVSVIPIAYAGDRFDKRSILLGAILVGVAAYVGFSFVESSTGFIVARSIQGVALVGTGMLSLALVGQLAGTGERANAIGKYNSFRMAAGIGGSLSAGALYAWYGFAPIFYLIAGLMLLAAAGIWLFLEPDETRVEGFAFTGLALNRRILTMTSFRAQYAVAVTLVRTWIPIYATLGHPRGGLALASFLVGVAVASEKFTNMLGQPVMGRLSDRHGRIPFVAVGG